ncbi:MAG TPA: type II secretion system protein GspE, partial [Stellaceae bacterium]|nr:type II secretion system protein GspE [Stellaceae bacterium]
MTAAGADRRPFERSIATRLIETGKLEEPALDRVLRLQTNSEERLEALLIKLGLAGERDVADAFAAELGLPVAAPSDFPEAPILDGKISKKFLRQANVLPLADTSEALILAMVDPLDSFAVR